MLRLIWRAGMPAPERGRDAAYVWRASQKQAACQDLRLAWRDACFCPPNRASDKVRSVAPKKPNKNQTKQAVTDQRTKVQQNATLSDARPPLLRLIFRLPRTEESKEAGHTAGPLFVDAGQSTETPRPKPNYRTHCPASRFERSEKRDISPLDEGIRVEPRWRRKRLECKKPRRDRLAY